MVVKWKCSSFSWIFCHGFKFVWRHWMHILHCGVYMSVAVYELKVKLHNFFTGKFHSTGFTFTLHLDIFNVNIEQVSISLMIFNLVSSLCAFWIDPDVAKLTCFYFLVVLWDLVQPQCILCRKGLSTYPTSFRLNVFSEQFFSSIFAIPRLYWNYIFYRKRSLFRTDFDWWLNDPSLIF